MPFPSVALIWKLWVASVRGPAKLSSLDSQAANASVSNLHSKVAPAGVEWYVNEALVTLVGLAGLLSIVVVGGEGGGVQDGGEGTVA